MSTSRQILSLVLHNPFADERAADLCGLEHLGIFYVGIVGRYDVDYECLKGRERVLCPVGCDCRGTRVRR